MASRQEFSPLCDLHHTAMRRVMLEENSEEIRTYHACERRDCTRVFRDRSGYSDWIEGVFDDSRASVRECAKRSLSLLSLYLQCGYLPTARAANLVVTR